jgi:hypothetical protein
VRSGLKAMYGNCKDIFCITEFDGCPKRVCHISGVIIEETETQLSQKMEQACETVRSVRKYRRW